MGVDAGGMRPVLGTDDRADRDGGPVTAFERMVLRHLANHPGATTNELALRLGVDAHTLSGTLHRLRAAGTASYEVDQRTLEHRWTGLLNSPEEAA